MAVETAQVGKLDYARDLYARFADVYPEMRADRARQLEDHTNDANIVDGVIALLPLRRQVRHQSGYIKCRCCADDLIRRLVAGRRLHSGHPAAVNHNSLYGLTEMNPSTIGFDPVHEGVHQ